METTPNIRARQELERLEVIAGNGLLGRRAFLRGGAAFAAAVTGYTVARSAAAEPLKDDPRSEEHTSELQSQSNLVCRLLLEKKKKRRFRISSAPREYRRCPRTLRSS